MVPSAEDTRVLLVSDEPMSAGTYRRWLSRGGFDVQVAEDGAQVHARLRVRSFDVLVCACRAPIPPCACACDIDLPVIAIGAGYELDNVYRWFPERPSMELLCHAVARAAGIRRLASARRSMLHGLGMPDHPIGALPDLARHFDLARRRLFMVYQPVVRWPAREIIGFEGLVRSDDATLPTPNSLLDAARRLEREGEVGRQIRALLGEAGGRAPFAVSGANAPLLFVNLMAEELLDPLLYDPDEPLGRIAERVVIEISERASFDEIPDARSRIMRLRELGFRFALDDLGAGYAGLNGLNKLDPDFVKLDRRLVSNLHREPTKCRLIEAVSSACDDLGIELIAEGVELVDERDALSRLGCQLMQGFLFAHPRRDLRTAIRGD